MTLKEFVNRKPTKIGILLFAIAGSVWSFYGLASLTRRTNTRALEREFAAAVDELHKSPPSIQRAEVFLERLKAIDSSHAPDEVKQALHDYISALEQGMNAVKAGRNTAQYDSAMGQAEQRLIRSMKEWD